MPSATADLANAVSLAVSDAARHVLRRLYGDGAAGLPIMDSALPVAAFQADAAARILRLLECRGGALLADSVGLGKTHVALAVIEAALRSGITPALAVTPSALRRQWVRPLRSIARAQGMQLCLPGSAAPGPGADALLAWTTHARLSRGEAPPIQPRLVIVDEAHGFRNPRTRRYRELARLCRGARVLLITATPVNNALSDLYFLLRLFLGDGDLADLGVPDLKAFLRFDPEAGSAPDPLVRTALASLTVRRTRRLVETGEGVPGMRFPRREPPVAVRYDLDGATGTGTLAAVLSGIEELELDVYDAALRPRAVRGPASLLRIGLLKRFESSAAAFRASLDRLDAFLRECASAVPEGRLPVARDLRGTDPGQTRLGALAWADLPAGSDSRHLLESALADLARIGRIRELLGARAVSDPKLDALLRLLGGPLARRSALVFTEFRDTALALHGAVRNRRTTGLVTGADALLGACPATRRRVIEAFAPVSNAARIPAGERIEVLIATDVLSEGLNLQDCGDVISFDLPWNPIRLVQRAGRVDRLGSPHDSVRTYNFMPDRGLDAILGLLDRLRSKVGAIRAAGGFDAPRVPGPDGGPPDLAGVLHRLRSSDQNLLPDLEMEAETSFELEERARTLATRQRPEPGGTTRSPASHGPAGPDRHDALERTRRRVNGEFRSDVDAAEPPVVATLVRPAGERPRWLVVAGVGANLRFFFADGGDSREDRAAALRMLADAVAIPARAEPAGTRIGPLPQEAVRAVASVLRFLALRGGARTRGSDPSGRAARLLLQRLRDTPGGPTPDLCRRADRVLDRLRPGLPRGAEIALDAALARERRGNAPDSAGLLARLEALLSGHEGRRPSGPVAGAGPPRLVALFRLMPDPLLTLESCPTERADGRSCLAWP